MPATVRVEFADGTREDVRLPAESWIRNASTSVSVPAGAPDKNRFNDSRKTLAR